MKLKNTTYNEDWPSFKLAKMNDEGIGVPFGESVTIRIADKQEPVKVNVIEYIVREGKAKKGQNVGDKASFTKAEVVGKVVGDEVENIKYNKYENASFEITENMANKLLELGEDKLRGMTVEFKLSSFEKSIDGTTQKIKFFEMSEITDDGSAKQIGGGKSAPPTPSGDTSLELSEPEKAIFKEARTNKKWADWKAYGLANAEQFKQMYKAIADNLSLPEMREGRENILYVQFCN